LTMKRWVLVILSLSLCDCVLVRNYRLGRIKDISFELKSYKQGSIDCDYRALRFNQYYTALVSETNHISSRRNENLGHFLADYSTFLYRIGKGQLARAERIGEDIQDKVRGTVCRRFLL